MGALATRRAAFAGAAGLFLGIGGLCRRASARATPYDPWAEVIGPCLRTPEMLRAMAHATAAGMNPDDLACIMWPLKPRVSLHFKTASFDQRGRLLP